MNKSVAHKRSKGSSSSSFDMQRFMQADAQARFNDLVKQKASLKERGCEIDSSHLAYFEAIIVQSGWQEFCKPPNVAAMTLVREFYKNAFESPVSISMVRERQVKYDVVTINPFLKIQNAPLGPDQVAQLDNTIDLDEVTRELCDKVVTWTMV